MTSPTIAEKLGIEPNTLVWLVGDTVEENSLLDPLPDGVETYQYEPETEADAASRWQDNTWGAMFGSTPPEVHRPHGIDTALIVVSHAQEFHHELDDNLTRMGSVGRVWLVFTPATLSESIVVAGTADYGWKVVESRDLNETWTARRLRQ